MRLAVPLVCAAALLCTGCLYRIDIQQGNAVVQESLAKVKPGMSRNEVKQILGEPDSATPNHGGSLLTYAAKGVDIGLREDATVLTITLQNGHSCGPKRYMLH